jgi:hypothetical protein
VVAADHPDRAVLAQHARHSESHSRVKAS